MIGAKKLFVQEPEYVFRLGPHGALKRSRHDSNPLIYSPLRRNELVPGHRPQTLGMDTSLEESLDLNLALLTPLDQRMRDPLRLATYTLQNLRSSKNTQASGRSKILTDTTSRVTFTWGAAAVWSHPPKGAPGAPANIDTEFTVAGKHIDFYLSHDRRLQQMLTSWYQ